MKQPVRFLDRRLQDSANLHFTGSSTAGKMQLRAGATILWRTCCELDVAPLLHGQMKFFAILCALQH